MNDLNMLLSCFREKMPVSMCCIELGVHFISHHRARPVIPATVSSTFLRVRCPTATALPPPPLPLSLGRPPRPLPGLPRPYFSHSFRALCLSWIKRPPSLPYPSITRVGHWIHYRSRLPKRRQRRHLWSSKSSREWIALDRLAFVVHSFRHKRNNNKNIEEDRKKVRSSA